MNVKKILALTLALAMVFALVACAPKDNADNNQQSQQSATQQPQQSDTQTDQSASAEEPSQPVDTTPIKIGHIVDLVGTQAMTGEEAKRALEFAVKDMGGEIAGRPIEIIVGDAQDTTTGAVDAARKMVEEDEVVAIFGPTQPGQKTAVAEYMNECGLPLILYNASPNAIIDNYDWVVGAGGTTPQLPTVMADYVYNTLGYKTVNTLTMDNIGFRSFMEPFVEYYEELGGKVLTQQWAPFSCGDWGPYFLAMEDADAIIAWASGSDAISLWGAWETMGISDKMPMIGPHHGGFTDYFVPKALSFSVPDAAESMLGALSPMPYTYDIDTPENEEFVAKWKAEFGEVPATNLPGSCYQAMLLLKAALESTNGDTTPEKLINALFAADVTGPEGRVRFDGSHAATKNVYITEVVKMEDGSYNNNIVTVYEDVPPTGLTK